MMTSNPEVSVLVSVCNNGSRLVPSLRSVLEQEDVALELVMVDDGSTDGSSEVLRALAVKDARVKVLRQNNRGLTRALIRGMKEARGTYIARHDAGDVSLPGRLSKQLEVLRQTPATVMVACGCRVMAPGGEIMDEWFPADAAAEWSRVLQSGDSDRLYGPPHGSVMFCRDAYDAAGGYRAQFYFAQDLDLWTRLVEVGRVGCVNEVLYERQFRYKGASARFGRQQAQLRQLIACAARMRAKGEPEDELLNKAARIGKLDHGNSGEAAARVRADYFIGSCLAKRRHLAAKRYLDQVVRRDPFHVKAWSKLLWIYASRPFAAGSR